MEEELFFRSIVVHKPVGSEHESEVVHEREVYGGFKYLSVFGLACGGLVGWEAPPSGLSQDSRVRRSLMRRWPGWFGSGGETVVACSHIRFGGAVKGLLGFTEIWNSCEAPRSGGRSGLV